MTGIPESITFASGLLARDAMTQGPTSAKHVLPQNRSICPRALVAVQLARV